MNKVLALLVGLSAVSFASFANAQALPYANVTTTQLDANGSYQRTVTPTGAGVAGDYWYVDGNGQPQHQSPGLTSAGTTAGIVVNYSQALRRSILKVTVPYSAFSAAAKTADVVIATIQPKAKIVGIVEDATVAFTGGGETAATLMLGVTTGGNTLLVANSVFTTATWGLADADAGTAFTRAAQIQGGYIPSWTTSTNISARLTTTTNNTSGLTAGSVTYYIITEQY
jgi:hypothetical protein